ncbi:MAG: DUF551 domain-containing protein [Bacteroides sp.]|uniref:DUF551 domain-containing protein n=1 Tax=Bacteroides sp. TaxID=29523 RepID=UPI002FC76379
MNELDKASIQFSKLYPENDCVKQDVINAFEAGAEWQAKQSPWIRVEDRLPDTDKGQSLYEVLVKMNDGKCYVAANIDVESIVEIVEATHWMPIPE